MLAAGEQSSIALAQPDLGFPTDVLDGFRWCFESELQMPADFRRIAIRPSAFYQSATSMGVAGFGDGALAAAFTSGWPMRPRYRR